MNSIYLLLFLVTAAINSVVQLLLKRGSQDVGNVIKETGPLIGRLFKIFTNPFVLGAALSLAIGMVIWLWLVSRVEVSRAYPINIALTIIITSIAATFLFHEPFTLMKFIGTGFIVAGLWFLLVNV